MPAILDILSAPAPEKMFAGQPHTAALRPVAPSVGSITDGLAQVLSQGLPIPMNTAPGHLHGAQMLPQPRPQYYSESEMQPQQRMPMQQHQEEPVSLDASRQQLMGQYFEELEGRMKELRQVMEGGVARARKAMLERVDELGAALHRDMVSLRQEVQKEVEELKRDVFTTVMSVSAINDKMGLAESRNRETWMAITKALADRIDNQAKANTQALESFYSGANDDLDQRVVKVVESTLMRLAAVRRGEAAPPRENGQPASVQA